jgi:hypothetical protein
MSHQLSTPLRQRAFNVEARNEEGEMEVGI